MCQAGVTGEPAKIQLPVKKRQNAKGLVENTGPLFEFYGLLETTCMIKRIWKRLRRWIIVKLLTEDEKYVLSRCIDDRVDHLYHRSINEKFSESDCARSDAADLSEFRGLITTKLWA